MLIAITLGVLVIVNLWTTFILGGLMATQVDLVNAVSDLDAAITALEQKPDSTPGNIDQATLDNVTASVQGFKARVDAETAKK